MDMKRYILPLLMVAFGASAQEECSSVGIGEKIVTVPEEFGCGILECFNQTSNSSQYSEYEFAGWILPDLRIVNATYDDGRITVEEGTDSFTIRVREVTRADVGLYHCMLTYTATGEYFLIRLGLNAKGPFFISGWEEYKMNTIVGCSAFGGFLVLTIIVYLFWHFRYQAPEEEDEMDTYTAKESNFDSVNMSSVPNYVPTIDGQNGKPPASNWSFAQNSPGDLRKRNADKDNNGPIQAYENRGYTADPQSPTISDQVVGEFFGGNIEPDVKVASTAL